MKTARLRGVVRGIGGSIALFAALSCARSAEAVQPHTSQNISLVAGWNAVYVEVAPEQTADEIFASWPVDHVGLYDPASFLATRQFSADWNSQGLPRENMIAWYRGVPEASSLKSIPAGSVLVTFCKQASFLATLRGVPAAPRTTWHVTGPDTVYNFIGFSVSQRTEIAAYLEGSPCENVESVGYYRVGGDDSGEVPESRAVRTFDKFVNDGGVLLMPSTKISDWSGVLNVSPMGGVDFGQDSSMGKLAIRNDGKTERTVRVEFAQALNHDELFKSPTLPSFFHVIDMDTAVTNAFWEKVELYGKTLYKKLAPGETWNLGFGLDRKKLQENELRKGLSFGALIKVSEDSSAHAKAVVPICGETSGNATEGWPNGLWVADVELDSIRMVELRRVVETNNVGGVQVVMTNAIETALSEKSSTGGKFKLRLPIHRDREGTTRLLQRVVSAGSTSENGTFNYKLYAGAAKPLDTDTTLMRISAVCLPTELPVIEASKGNLWSTDNATGESIGELNFEFTVAPNGATSILRHPYHPQHDGLRWDFKTSAPDGDDVYNYKYDVKPETFSVKSEIKLVIDYGEGVRLWNPEESYTGTCEWSLSGLRHDGKVVVSGPMTIRRISPAAQLTLK